MQIAGTADDDGDASQAASKYATKGNCLASKITNNGDGPGDGNNARQKTISEDSERAGTCFAARAAVLVLVFVTIAVAVSRVKALVMPIYAGGDRIEQRELECGTTGSSKIELGRTKFNGSGDGPIGQGPSNVLPFNSDICPYAIPKEEEGKARDGHVSVPGNILVVTDFNFCRLANRFISMSRSLNLGYCCKSKLVSLPPKDDQIAPGIFGEGSAGPRHFDFSSAPDVEGFDSASCPANITWGGIEAFYLRGLRDVDHPYYTPGLFSCVKTLRRITGCEAAYFFPTDIDVCYSGGAGNGEEVVPEQRSDATGIRLEWGEKEQGRGQEETDGAEIEAKTGGNLVVHVRSGDIFVSPPHPDYGQYYIRAIQDQKWDRVDIVTNGFTDKYHEINPVIPALEGKVATGELPGIIHFHKNRTMGEDLVSMICADGFVAAKSTLRHLVSHHSSASRMYFPVTCDETLETLDSERRGTKVFGMTLPKANYTVFQRWNNTADQLAEMMTFDILGFERCIGSRN